jgi:SHS2 domain-containing protein
VHRPKRKAANKAKRPVRSSFRILEHPSDLGIEAYARTLSGAFAACARGLVSIFVDPSTVRIRDERRVSLTAHDRDQLLVKWLEEILYLYDGEGFVSKKSVISTLTGTNLEGFIRGELFDSARHRSRLDVKAITYHQLLIRENKDGVVVRVFVDI